MSNVIFQPPAGLAWSTKKRPRYGTIVQDTTSGRSQLRIAKQQYPIWEYEMNWEYLTGAEQSAIGANAGLQQMMGFFMARQGAYDDFLYSDPNDNTVTGMPFGTGDGTTLGFQLTRNIGSGVDIVQNLNQSVSAPKIYKYDWQGTKNLLLNSEDMSTGSWTKDGASTIVAQAGFDPAGGNAANLFTKGFGVYGNYANLAQNLTGDATLTPLTFSIWLWVTSGSITGSLAISDVSHLTQTTNTITITKIPQRFTFTSNPATFLNTGSIGVGLNLTGGAGTQVYAWGAQLEIGSSATSYQKTGANNWGPTLQYSTARTNKFIWTEAADNAAWTKAFNGTASAPTVTADTIVAPDGTTTADAVTYSVTGGAGSYSDLYQAISSGAGAGTSWTASIWLKAASATTITLILADSNGFTGNGLVSQVVNVTTKWQRFSLSTSFTGGAGSGVAFSIRNEQSQPSKTIHVWGIQLEAGLTLTPYIKATSSIVTVTDYSIDSKGIVTFAAPPANNALLTWDGSYYYRLHFTDDINDFDNFMFQLWDLQSVKFESVIL
jgi:hypothetical protein